MYIEYYAYDGDMGEGTTEDFDKYRAWAKNELEHKYPEHDIRVYNEMSAQEVKTDDFENEDDIKDFCYRLWDRGFWEKL